MLPVSARRAQGGSFSPLLQGRSSVKCSVSVHFECVAVKSRVATSVACALGWLAGVAGVSHPLSLCLYLQPGVSRADEREAATGGRALS